MWQTHASRVNRIINKIFWWRFVVFSNRFVCDWVCRVRYKIPLIVFLEAQAPTSIL